MLNVTTARSNAPPSRGDNPFATCWTRPGAIPFHFTNGLNAEQLVSKLAAQQWRGAIVGPHGSGKSTLLESLKRAMIAAGRNIQTITLRDGERRLPRHFFAAFAKDAGTVAIIDGYEQLGWPARVHLWLRCRFTNACLLVTSHTPVRVPMLVQLSPDVPLIEQLVDDLCAGVSTTIARADIAASHACYGSNVREVFFDLYDRHEERRRKLNPFTAAP